MSRRNLKNTLKRISCTAALTPLVGGTALNLALPIVTPHGAEVQAQTPTFITQLQQMQLTASDFRNMVCMPYAAIWSQVLGAADSLDNMCAYLVAQPGFYDQQVHTYEMRVRDNAGMYRSFYIYNLYGAMYQTPGAGTTFPALPLPNRKDLTGIRGINYASNPTITSTFTYASTNQERLTMPIPAFTYPSWFVNHTQSQPYLSVFAIDYQDDRGAGNSTQFTATPASFLVIRTGSLTQAVSIPYTLGGTATPGTDYQFVTAFPHPTSPQTHLYIAAGESFATYLAQGYGVQNSALEETIQLTVQPPTGYSQGTALSDAGWFGALQIPAITFTANGSTTIQPGSSTTFTITRSGAPTTEPLEVYYTMGGTASNGADYSYLDGSTTISAGQAAATVTVTVPAKTGDQAIPTETITLTPTDTDTYNPMGGLSYEIAAYTPSMVNVTTSGSGLIQRGMSGNFTINRATADNTPLTVHYSLSGTATPGHDYISPTGTGTIGSVTIPSGQTSIAIPVSVPVPSGTQTLPSTTIVLTIQSGAGYTLGTGASATLTIPAYTLQTVSLPAQGTTLMPGGTTDSVTVTRTGETSSPLTVGLTVGGTATEGTDYSQLPGSVIIPAGQTSVSIPLRAFINTGSQSEPAETITLAIAPGNGYTPTSTTPITYTIPAYTPATVSLPDQGTTLTPGGMTDSITITRTGDPSQPLVVGLTSGGTASAGLDYGHLPATVTIPAGSHTATIPIRAFPQTGTQAVPQETVTVAIAPGNGYTPATTTPITYWIPAYTPVGTPTVTVSIPNTGDTTLMPGETAGVTFTRSGEVSNSLPVNYTVGGTATNGTDYSFLDGSLVIPAGQSTATVQIRVPAELSTTRTGKTLEIDLAAGSGYTDGTNTSVNYTLDVPVPIEEPEPEQLGILVRVVGDAFVIVCEKGPCPEAIPLTIAAGGSALPGTDYRSLEQPLTLPAGSTGVEVPITLLPEATGGRTITLELDMPPNVTQVSSQSYVIPAQVRNPRPIVILTPSVDEALPGFVVARPAGDDLTVPLTLTYQVGGTAIATSDYRILPGTLTIPAGQTRAEIPVHIMRGATAGRIITLNFNAPPEGYLIANADPLTLRLSRDLIARFTGRDNTNGDNNTGNTGNDNAPNNSSRDDSSSNGSGVLSTLAGVVGLGGLTALGTGSATGSEAMCSARELPEALMQLVEQSGVSVASTQLTGGISAPNLETHSHDELDWTMVSFSMLPAVNGTPADQSFTLGVLEGLDNDIALGQLMEDSSYTLLSSGLVGNSTTLGALTQTLYADAEMIDEVEGLAEYLAQHTGGEVEELAQLPLETVRHTEQLANIDLQQLPLAQVPGLVSMELDQLPNWQQLPVARIPGMSRAPFSELFPCLEQQDDEEMTRRNEGNNE